MRGHGSGQRHRSVAALRRQEVAQRGRAHNPRLHDGGLARAASSRRRLFDPDKPIRKFTKKELARLLYKEPTKMKVERHQPHLRGPDPADPEVVPVEGRRRDAAAHPRVRRARGDVHHVSRLQRHAAQRGGAVVEDQGEEHRRRRARCRSATWPSGCADLEGAVRRAAAAKLRQTLDSFVEIGLGYLSLDRPSGTLSGGEAQRTKMVGHLGSSLTDVTYVFDEPTIGMHPHDIQRMNRCCCGCATRATPCSSSSTSRR